MPNRSFSAPEDPKQDFRGTLCDFREREFAGSWMYFFQQSRDLPRLTSVFAQKNIIQPNYPS